MSFDLRCYHIDDEYSFSPVETAISPDEMQILKEADQVFVTSGALLEKKGWVNPNTSLVPNGVDYQAFATPCPEPLDLAPVRHPRIGYTGFLKEQLDWQLLLELSARHPDWSFVFVGPVSPRPAVKIRLQELLSRKNVHLLGGKPSHLVPAYTQNFDVCIMPYKQNDYTKYIYPLKLHEYLASGRPTVGTRIRTLEDFADVLSLVCTTDEWSAALDQALKPEANAPQMRAARQTVAKKHDWDVLVEKIAMILVVRIAPEFLPRPSLALLAVPSEEILRPNPSARAGTQAALGYSPSTSTQESDTARASQGSSDIASSPALSVRQTAAVGPVLLVSPWYRPAVGGVVEVAESLHQSLTDVGVQTHLLIAHEGEGGLEADPYTPCLWRLASASSVFHHLSFKSALVTAGKGSLAYWRLHRFVRRHKIKTVILIYPISYAWLFLLLRRTTDIRLIASLHGNDVTKYDKYEATARWLIRRVLRNCDAIISCANHLADKVQEILPDHPHLELIPNCVDTNYFTPPPPGFVRTDRRRTFVHVSNFAPKKRTVDIVEAFADPRIPFDTRLIMVGDGAERFGAAERARSLGVHDRVEFVGIQEDVRPFLWQADVFLLASDDEGAPLALLEAMACGLPWVSTAWGPAAMLPREECGLIVPAHSPHLLAAAMAELIRSPERMRGMGQRARYRAETDFREDKYVKRHLDVIRSVEQSSSSRQG